MKVYLDDLRPTPEGWVHVYWPEEAIELLKTGKVEIISLDHDLLFLLDQNFLMGDPQLFFSSSKPLLKLWKCYRIKKKPS